MYIAHVPICIWIGSKVRTCVRAGPPAKALCYTRQPASGPTCCWVVRHRTGCVGTSVSAVQLCMPRGCAAGVLGRCCLHTCTCNSKHNPSPLINVQRCRAGTCKPEESAGTRLRCTTSTHVRCTQALPCLCPEAATCSQPASARSLRYRAPCARVNKLHRYGTLGPPRRPGSCLDRGHGLLGCIVQVISCDDGHAAGLDDILAPLYVGALQPHHQRHLHAHLQGGSNTICMSVYGACQPIHAQVGVRCRAKQQPRPGLRSLPVPLIVARTAASAQIAAYCIKKKLLHACRRMHVRSCQTRPRMHVRSAVVDKVMSQYTHIVGVLLGKCFWHGTSAAATAAGASATRREHAGAHLQHASARRGMPACMQGSLTCFAAFTMPLAMTSHFMMPPAIHTFHCVHDHVHQPCVIAWKVEGHAGRPACV